MTLIDLAARAETAMDDLTTALNTQSCTSPEVAEKLRGIAHSLLLAVGTIACAGEGDTAGRAGAASDLLLASLPALDDLADAMRQDEDRRILAA
jgi:hypothetical protein